MNDKKSFRRRQSMKFDGNSRYSQRADYEQFSQLLGLNVRPTPRMEQKPNYQTNNESCVCQNNTHLAMVYPVKQEFCDIYDVEIALINGTIFTQLNKPFYPTGCSCKMKEGCL